MFISWLSGALVGVSGDLSVSELPDRGPAIPMPVAAASGSGGCKCSKVDGNQRNPSNPKNSPVATDANDKRPCP